MPRSSHSRRFVRDAARALVARLEARSQGSVQRLGSDPLGVVGSWSGINLVMTNEREVGTGCSVSGSYDYDSGRVVVGQASSRGRRFFTVLHEFGHHLQQHEEESVQLLEKEEDNGRALEDDICDAFAAEVLLPDEIVDRFVNQKGPTAYDVVDLIHGSSASREACCVRAVQRLPGRGYVMLCDRSGLAIFTASTTGYPVRRNTPQLGNEVVESAVRSRTGRQLSRVRFPSGALSPKYYADAAVDGDYLIAVLVEHMAPWEKGLHYAIPEPNYGVRAPSGGDGPDSAGRFGVP